MLCYTILYQISNPSWGDDVYGAPVKAARGRLPRLDRGGSKGLRPGLAPLHSTLYYTVLLL
eukprot:16445042-Heterocapsa_arctica.AAC.1